MWLALNWQHIWQHIPGLIRRLRNLAWGTKKAPPNFHYASYADLSMLRGSHLKTGITDRHRQVARKILAEGKPIRKALLEAGYSEASANQGMARIRRSVPLAAAYAQEIERLKNLPVPSAEVRAQIVRAKLLENVRDNHDNAVQSLKLLGQDREVSLWQPESAQGVILIQLPKDLPEDL